MNNRALPFLLEDRTGHWAASDFDEIYDRQFLRVSQASAGPSGDAVTILIHDTGRRSSKHRQTRPPLHPPAVALEFAPGGALGTISFVGSSMVLPMSQYLRKTSIFAGSLSRKFTASNGEEYRWIYKSVKDHEWSLVDSRDFLVGHYVLKPPEKPAYNTSGNVLTIYEPFTHLSIEILASLTIMRYIAAHKL